MLEYWNVGRMDDWVRPASVCAEGMPLAEDLAESVKEWMLRKRKKRYAFKIEITHLLEDTYFLYEIF